MPIMYQRDSGQASTRLFIQFLLDMTLAMPCIASALGHVNFEVTPRGELLWGEVLRLPVPLPSPPSLLSIFMKLKRLDPPPSPWSSQAHSSPNYNYSPIKTPLAPIERKQHERTEIA